MRCLLQWLDENGEAQLPGCDEATATFNSALEAEAAARDLEETDPETWRGTAWRFVPVATLDDETTIGELAAMLRERGLGLRSVGVRGDGWSVLVKPTDERRPRLGVGATLAEAINAALLLVKIDTSLANE